MPFDNIPIKPLGRIWTLKMVVDTILQWLREETQQRLDPEFVKTLVNVAINDTAEFLSGAGSDDYGRTAFLNDILSNVSASVKNNGVYTDSLRRITRTSHGLTSGDIGKRIVYITSLPTEGPNDRCVITEIEEIIDANNFRVKIAAGVDIPNIRYAVFPTHTAMSVDLSPYRISNITKITDTVTGEVIKVGDREFDNLQRFTEKQNKVYYFQHGQVLYLYKGTRVTNIGTLTMFYNSYPQLFTDENSLLDIKDNYVPLVIATAKNYCLEHLGLAASEQLNNVIDAKKREIKENILREKSIIEQKNQNSKVNV